MNGKLPEQGHNKSRMIRVADRTGPIDVLGVERDFHYY